MSWTSCPLSTDLHPQLRDLIEEGRLRVYVPKKCSSETYPKRIYVLGTSHLSERSSKDVKRVVLACKPRCVVVELCRSRSGALYEGGDPRMSFGLGGERFRDALMRSLSLGGAPALLLRLFLNRIYGRMSTLAQAQVGKEFYVARESAEEVGAQIVLGDRPIEITLKRAWDGLGWKSRGKLLLLLISSLRQVDKMDFSQSTMEALMEEDLWSVASRQVGSVLPELMPAIVHERDIYIAWSLKRSKAVREAETVVGVIGKGHMDGVMKALEEDQGRLRFKDLVGTKEDRRPKVGAVIRRVSIDTAVLFALGWVWNQLPHGSP